MFLTSVFAFRVVDQAALVAALVRQKNGSVVGASSIVCHLADDIPLLSPHQLCRRQTAALDIPKQLSVGIGMYNTYLCKEKKWKKEGIPMESALEHT